MKGTTTDKIPTRFTLRPNHGLDDATLARLAGLLHVLESNPDDAMALREIEDDGLYLAVAGNLETFKGILQSPGTALIDNEANVLSQYEAVIERGQQTFLEVGAALAQIREQKLYRAGFKTFEDYCQARWDWTKRRANQLIGAAEVVADLGTVVPKTAMPVSERQVRPLSRLPPTERGEAWKEACEESGGQPTAEQVVEAVERRLAKAGPPEKPDRHPPGQPERETARQDGTFTVAVCYQKDAKTLLSHYRNIVLVILSPIEKVKAGPSKPLCAVTAQGIVPKVQTPLDVVSGPRLALEKSWPGALKLSPGLLERKGWVC